MIPYGRQSIDEEDIAEVAKVLRGDFLTTGPKVAEFERALCDLTGAKHAVACSNGTTALHLAGLALNLQAGDHVIVPTLTFLATANAVRYCGAEVIFADVDPHTGIMTAEHLAETLENNQDKTIKAVFPVHLTGQCVDMEKITPLARAHNLKIIADCAHAIGSQTNGAQAGACIFEDMATFSFHPVKTIAAGEGGAIMTNRQDQAERMRRLRSHGMAPAPAIGPWAYEIQELGFNYRMTDFQCALGLSQLQKIDRFIARRSALATLYDTLLHHIAPVIAPPKRLTHCCPAWHLYAVRIDFDALGMTRADLMNALRDRGIGTQVHYIPVHHQPYYKNRYGTLALQGADHYYEHTLSLPLFPAMTERDVAFVVDNIKNIIGA